MRPSHFTPGLILSLAAPLGFCLALPSVVNAQTNVRDGLQTNPPPIAIESSTNGLGSWIWASHTTDRQTCRLWRSIEIPATATVTHAELRMTVDNEFVLFLDGRNLGRGGEWNELFDFNLTYLLAPGPHVLAVEAYNDSDYAGLILGMEVDLSDGRRIDIKSDDNWRVVPNTEKHWETATRSSEKWPRATVIGPLGTKPWWLEPHRVNTMELLLPIKVPFWRTGWFQISVLAVCGAAILVSLRLVGQLAIHRRERWLLQKERGRIARDIHDDVGSRLTQLVLHGEVAQSELPPESATRQQIDQICQEAREVLSTMDEILWGLNPKRDTYRDFTSYICGYAQGFLKSTEIQCLFDVAPQTASVVLELPFRRALLMAVKESLNNAVKHSGATEIMLRMACEGQTLAVILSDNGRGFDPARAKPGRNGLANMAQRLEEVGGSCRVTSRPGQGCRTELSVRLRHRLRPRSWRWSAEERSGRAQPSDPLETNYS